MASPAKRAYASKVTGTKKAPDTRNPVPDPRVPVDSVDYTSMTPAMVLYLQRTVGNQAVQRVLSSQVGPDLIQRQPTKAPKPKPKPKPRTGLRKSAATGRFARAAQNYMSNPKNGKQTTQQLCDQLKKFVNDELKPLGVYPIVAIKNGSKGNCAAFDPELWVIQVNFANTFGSATTIGQFTSAAKKKELVDSVYHEARHAEQWFRVLRLRAGRHTSGVYAVSKGQPGAAYQSQKTTKTHSQTAAAIHQYLPAVYFKAIQAAVRKPLLPTAKSADLPEALVWEKSYVTLNSDYAEAVRKLKGPAAQMTLKLGQYFGGPGGNPDPKLEREIKAIYKKHFPTHANSLIKAHTLFQTLPAGQQTVVEKAIFKRLTTMKPHIDASLAARTPTKQDPDHLDLGRLYNHMYHISTELDSAYRALPEEVDAFAAGRAAKKAYASPPPAKAARP